jgi:hypothetical protein
MVPIPFPKQNTALSDVWRLIAVGTDSVLELRPVWGKKVPNPKKSRSFHFRMRDYESVEACKKAFESKVIELNQQGFNVYTVMNPIRPDFAGPRAAADADIRYRDLLLIDIDRVGDTSCPADQAELDAAKVLAREIRQYLTDRDWPKPIMVMSGNGYHLYYVIRDVPNHPDSDALIRSILRNLANKFNNAVVGVDTSVFNASRITKVPGTIARKGEATANRPYRMAEVCDED